MSVPNTIEVEIPGCPPQDVSVHLLPPVGTRFTVHKHLTDGGTYMTLEVTEHEWRLEEANEMEDKPGFSIKVRTKRIA